jgi:hypothetical protein
MRSTRHHFSAAILSACSFLFAVMQRQDLTQVSAPQIMKITVLILSLFVAGAACAKGLAPATSREINQLFTALENSRCEFNRNGTWYNTQEASAHLHQKFAYLRKRDMIASTEAFIDLAASKSSMTDKPYLVRCGNSQPVSSKSWFLLKLKALRASPAAADNSSRATPLRGAA